MADMDVTSQGGVKIDLAQWKKMTPQEIIQEEGNGEEVPAEILQWAQQVAAFSQIPDDVTYDQVDGDTGVEALDRLGITPENEVQPQDENAMPPEKPEEPDALKDVDKPEEMPDENIFAGENPQDAPPLNAPSSETAEDAENNEELTLADDAITTDNEEIQKRRRRKGQPEG